MSMRTVAILATAAAASLAHAANPVTYAVRELPPLKAAPCPTGQPGALSPTSGLVVGTSCRRQGGQPAAVVWDGATSRALISPSADYTSPAAVNDRGQAAGWIDDSDLIHTQAVLWRNDGHVSPLAPLAEGDSTEAWGISATGDVAGLELNDGDNRWIPVQWHHRQPKLLALPASQVGGYVTTVSAQGVMAGRSYDATGAERAILWQGGSATLVGPKMSMALGVNDAGTVVGEYRPFPGVDGSFLATTTSTTILSLRSASAINSAGVVVGDSGGQAVRWFNGQVQAFDTLLDAEARAAGWRFYFAGDIDDAGRVIATGERNDGLGWRTVELVPAGL